MSELDRDVNQVYGEVLPMTLPTVPLRVTVKPPDVEVDA